MTIRLEFGSPREVIFGSGEVRRVGELARRHGRRAVIIMGGGSLRESGGLDLIGASLREAGVEFEAIGFSGEPTVASVDELWRRAREFKPDTVIGAGGGSPMDAAKAVGGILTNAASGDSARDFLEGVGTKQITLPATPIIAIPTTAGTGSEATKNAVIRSDDWTFKKSMRSASMRPETALVDPELTLAAPAEVTAFSGADALTQLIESFTSARRNLFTDGLAREGLRLAAWALERVHLQPDDLEAREAMAMASLISGVTLDNAGLGAAHGLASPIGAMRDIPHGVICAQLLAPVTAANIAEARKLDEQDLWGRDILERYGEIARMFNGDFQCEPEHLVESLEFRIQQLGIPTLGACGLTTEDIPRVIAACRAGSMRSNPFVLSDETLEKILTGAVEALA